jgi:predicted nucleic acid-binding protein
VIVVDASAALELLLRGPRAEAVEQRLFGRRESLAAPHLIDIEAAQVLRRLVRRGGLEVGRAEQAFEDLAALPIARYAHLPLVARIWALRDNATACDACHLVLAEALGGMRVTCDGGLRAVPGCRAEVVVIE